MSEHKFEISIEEVPRPKSIIGVRHFQYVLMFITLLISFGIRTSLSVSIISMTAKTPPDPSIPTYPHWDNVDVILSSFFWGYIIPQVGAGQLSEYFGPKWFLFTTMIIGSIVNIVIPPVAASLGPSGVIACRIIQGLTQGFVYPSIHNLISRWAPLFERSRVSNFVYGGGTLGIAVAMLLTGAIAGSRMGWPMAFYVFGSVGVVWALIFAVFAENSPSVHKKISEEEKNYIQSSNSVTSEKTKIPTPWKAILTSLPVWAILCAGIAQCFGWFTLLTEIPSYMSYMLKFDINSNSGLAALPYIAQFLLGLIVSPLADWLITKKIFTITTTRKVFNALATFVPGAALIYLAFLENFTQSIVTVLLVIAVSFSSFILSGYLVNIIDIAPNHSGTVLGVVNCLSNIFSILGPLTVGLFGDDKNDPLLWRKVFLLAAGIYFGCGLFYVIFTSAEVQKWNDMDKNKEKVKS